MGKTHYRNPGLDLGLEADFTANKLLRVFQGFQRIFGSNSSQHMDYPTLICWQWSFLPTLNKKLLAELSRWMVQNSLWQQGYFKTSIFSTFPKLWVIPLSRVTPCPAAAPSLSCARKGTARSTAFISYGVHFPGEFSPTLVQSAGALTGAPQPIPWALPNRFI